MRCALTVKKSYRIVCFFIVFMLCTTEIFADNHGWYKFGTDDKRSVFDVTDNISLENKKLALECQWDFYFNRFIMPQDTQSIPDFKVEVPKVWNDYEVPPEYRKAMKKGMGSATYRLTVRGLKPKTMYCFETYKLAYTAFWIYADDKLIYESGTPDTDYKKTKAQQYFDEARFETDKDGCVTFTIHVSNYYYRKGGFRNPIKLIEVSGDFNSFAMKVVGNGLLCGVLLIITLYCFFFYIIKRDYTYLYLSIFVFLLLLRISVVDMSFVKLFIPEIPFSVMMRLEYLPIFMGPPVYIKYINSVNPRVFERYDITLLSLPGFILLVIDVFAPIIFVNRLVPVMELYAMAMIAIGVILFVIQIVKCGDARSIASLATCVFVAVGILFDVLLLNNTFEPSVRISTVSFAFYSVAQTVFLAFIQNKNFIQVKTLNNDLYEINKAYYRFVPKEFLDLMCITDVTQVHSGECIQSKAAILSADIRNFTAISEKMTEVQVFEMLNRYLREIAPVIRKHNGIIEKYLGDGIIAIFVGGASCALDCAVEMQSDMMDLRKEFEIEGLPEIRIGIGIHYGDITLGMGGDNNRMTEISLSSDIDVAVTAESMTKTYNNPIIVTKELLEQVDEYTVKHSYKYYRLCEYDGKDLYCIEHS